MRPDGTSKHWERAVRDDEFRAGSCLDHGRIIFESFCLGGSNSWIVRSNLEFTVSWQAQYLVMLQDDSCCSAHHAERFMCGEAQSSVWFLVAGAVLCQVAVSLLVAGAIFGEVAVMLERNFLWQAQHLLKFWAIAGARLRVAARIMLGSWSDYLRIVLSWRKQVMDFSIKSWTHNNFVADAIFGDVTGWLLLLRASCWTFHVWRGSIISVIFPGRCRTLSSCSVTFRSRGNIWKGCSDVGEKLLVAGTAFGEFLGNSWSEIMSCGPDHAWIMVGLSSNRFVLAEAIHGFFDQILNSQFRGRRTIWWCYRMTLVAQRIVLDVSCVTRLNHQCVFSWQVQQCLVILEGDSYWIAPRMVLDVSCVRSISHRCHFSWPVQCLVKLECPFSWQGVFGEFLGEKRGREMLYFLYKMTKWFAKMGRVMSSGPDNFVFLPKPFADFSIASWAFWRSRRSCAFSDFLLVCFAWWAQWICHIFLIACIHGCMFDGRYSIWWTLRFASVQNLGRHVLRLSNMNVVVPVCFTPHTLLRPICYWTFHVLRLPDGVVRSRSL